MGSLIKLVKILKNMVLKINIWILWKRICEKKII